MPDPHIDIDIFRKKYLVALRFVWTKQMLSEVHQAAMNHAPDTYRPTNLC